jgi:2-haloacid dehalogenase
MYQALSESLFSQKTCPDPEKVFSTIGAAENRLEGENKSMLYPAVYVCLSLSVVTG